MNYTAKINKAKCYSIYDSNGQAHRRSFATIAAAREVADRMTRGLIKFEVVDTKSMKAVRNFGALSLIK